MDLVRLRQDVSWLMRRISVCSQVEILTFVSAAWLLFQMQFQPRAFQHIQYPDPPRAVFAGLSHGKLVPHSFFPLLVLCAGCFHEADPGAHSHGGFMKTPISVIFTLVSTERKHGVLGMTKYSKALTGNNVCIFYCRAKLCYVTAFVIDLIIYNSLGRFVYFKAWLQRALTLPGGRTPLPLPSGH